jgi:hypothetical protein
MLIFGRRHLEHVLRAYVIHYNRARPHRVSSSERIPNMRAWWLGFSDAGRGFYVFVGMGEQAFADPARAQLAWDVLDSFRFLPR